MWIILASAVPFRDTIIKNEIARLLRAFTDKIKIFLGSSIIHNRTREEERVEKQRNNKNVLEFWAWVYSPHIPLLWSSQGAQDYFVWGL